MTAPFPYVILYWRANMREVLGMSNRQDQVVNMTSESRLDNLEHQSMLYDFYGSLLNDSQNEIMSLYYEDNLSLSEIAGQLGMTRQAVHYSLKKAEHALEEYEDRLGLIAGFNKNQGLAAEAVSIIDRSGIAPELRDRLTELIEALAE